MPTMTAPATSSFLQRVKSSYSTGAGVLQTPVTASQPITQSAPSFSIDEQLDTLDQVVSQVEATLPAQAIPLAISQLPDPLNPTMPGGGTPGSAKERLDGGFSLDTSKIDTGTGIQVLETERPHELPVEVEGYLQHVEDNQQQLPPEIVISTDLTQPYLPAQPLTPVVVLPITPEIEAAGSKKNPHWSVRWLVEWSRKLMKVFSGSVIYAESEAQ